MSCNNCVYSKKHEDKIFCVLNNDYVPDYLISVECADCTTEPNF